MHRNSVETFRTTLQCEQLRDRETDQQTELKHSFLPAAEVTNSNVWHYHEASPGAVNPSDRNIWCVRTKSYKLVDVLVVHVSHLQHNAIV